MKKILLFTWLLLTGSLSFGQTPNTWVTKAYFGGTARSGALGFSIGSKGYIGTGDQKSDFWEYDPVTDVWSQKANFGGGDRSSAVGFIIGSKGYIGTGTGANGVYKKDFWEFDPIANTWTQKTDFPGTARYGAVGLSIGSKGYVGTGIHSNTSGQVFTLYNDFWEYDPVTNSWTQKASVPGGERYNATGFSIGSKGYVGTGFNNGHKNDFYEYNPATNIWTAKANFAGPARDGAAAFVIDGKGYVGTGSKPSPFGGSYVTMDIWQYNPVTNTWVQKADLPGLERVGAVAFSIGTKGYLGTGSTIFGSSSTFYQYTPDLIITTGGIPTTPLCPGATLDISFTVAGNAYGGNNYTAQLSDKYGSFSTPTSIGTLNGTAAGIISATIPTNTPNGNSYRIRVVSSNPAASIITDNGTNLNVGSPGDRDIWSQKANFPGGLRKEAVSFSIGSKGYMGTGEFGSFKNDFWEYDPATDTWSQKANFAGGLRKAAIAFSIGTKGYVGTGLDNTYTSKSDFWEYDPATNSWTQKANFIGGGRYNSVGFTVGSKGYIGPGYTSSSTKVSSLFEYNPVTDTWATKAFFPGAARDEAVGFGIGNKGYVGTGFAAGTGVSNDFWEYDPATNAWVQKANFIGAPNAGATGFAIGNKGYINSFGGFYEYDPGTNTWTRKSDIGDGRTNATGFVIGSKAYIGTGGNGQGYVTGFWEYTSDEVPSISITNGLTTVCSTTPAALRINSLVANAAYQWNLNGAPIAGATASTFNAALTGNYTLTVTGACFTATSQPLTISVIPAPADPVITASGPTTICSGNPVTLTASSPTPGVTYSWYNNGVLIPNANNSTYLASASGMYTSKSNSGNCSSLASNGITVTATTTPVPVISGLNTTYCKTDPLISLTGSPAGSTFTIDGVSATVFDPAVLSAGAHTVVLTSVNGACTGTASQVVTINPAVSVPVIVPAGPTSFCTGGSVTLNASNSNGTSYQWYFNGATINGATSASYTTSTSGNYSVNAVIGPCESFASAATTVTVNSYPGAPYVYQTGNTLTSNAPTGNQWYLNGNIIPGETNQSFTATTNGNYTVVVTTNGCASVHSNPISITTVGLKEEFAKQAISVFPNPNNGMVKVRKSLTPGDLRFGLYDLSGKQLLTGNLLAGEEVSEINMQQLPAGVYLLQVSAENKTSVFRILKD